MSRWSSPRELYDSNVGRRNATSAWGHHPLSGGYEAIAEGKDAVRRGPDCGVSPRLLWRLYIRVSQPEALPDLLTALSKRVHYVVEDVRPDVVAVGVLGSFADGGADNLRRFVHEWTAARPGVEAKVEMDELGAVYVLPTPLPSADIGDGPPAPIRAGSGPAGRPARLRGPRRPGTSARR